MSKKKIWSRIAMGSVVMAVLLWPGCLQKDVNVSEASSEDNGKDEGLDSRDTVSAELGKGTSGYSGLDAAQGAIVDKLLKHDLLQAPSGTPGIVQIDEEYLVKMQDKYPAIFDTAGAGDYEVKFENLLVIYDYENDIIEKQYVLKSLKLGG